MLYTNPLQCIILMVLADLDHLFSSFWSSLIKNRKKVLFFTLQGVTIVVFSCGEVLTGFIDSLSIVALSLRWINFNHGMDK